MLGELHEFYVFSKIELKSGYHLIRMNKREMNEKLLLKLNILYEWLVLSFRLTNAYNIFMRLINHFYAIL
jgi:hypothetical protein